MIPTQAIVERPFILLSDDTVTFDPGDPPNLRLIKAPFTPGPNIERADLVDADFDGATFVQLDPTLIAESLDPATNDVMLSMPAGATPYRWETATDLNLPQTIYGSAMIKDNNTDVIACELFDTPITLTAPNQVIMLPTPTLRMFAGAIT